MHKLKWGWADFFPGKRGLGAQKQPCVGEDDKVELSEDHGVWMESYCEDMVNAYKPARKKLHVYRRVKCTQLQAVQATREMACIGGKLTVTWNKKERHESQKKKKRIITSIQ